MENLHIIEVRVSYISLLKFIQMCGQHFKIINYIHNWQHWISWLVTTINFCMTWNLIMFWMIISKLQNMTWWMHLILWNLKWGKPFSLKGPNNALNIWKLFLSLAVFICSQPKIDERNALTVMHQRRDDEWITRIHIAPAFIHISHKI